MNPFIDAEKWSYKPKTVYEVTICPDDSKQFASKKDTRLRNCVDYHREILDKVNASYHLFCEVSHPQAGDATKCRYARIHWHGIIRFETPEAISEFLLHRWHELTGNARVQFNEYRPDVWPEYCRKQKEYLPRWTRLKNASWADIADVSDSVTSTSEKAKPLDLSEGPKEGPKRTRRSNRRKKSEE